MRRRHLEDVTHPDIKDNETWNTCPGCNHSWKDDIATPGIIHRTRKCKFCTRRTKDVSANSSAQL